jgi:hypothetical protein
MAWPFNTQQERQAEAMANILAENAYERRLERVTWTVKAVLAFVLGNCLTFLVMVGLDAFLNVTPTTVWEWFFHRG